MKTHTGNASAPKIENALGIPEATVRRMPAWKERPAAQARASRSRAVKERPLTSGILATRAGDDRDPSEIAAENELDDRMAATERRYLDQASPEERAAYYKLEKDEKTNVLWIFKSEVERGSSPPPSNRPPLRSRLGAHGDEPRS